MPIVTEVKENYVPLAIDDFEEGDRVYHAKGLRDSGLGTVKEIYDTWLNVLMDTGEWKKAEIVLFDRKANNWCWDTVLDLTKVETGTEISRQARRGRVFATVLQFVPNDSITLGRGTNLNKRQLTNSSPIVYQQHPGRPLEEYLLGWEVEA